MDVKENTRWFANELIKQWVEEGMTIEEAKAQWREMESYGE